MRGSLGFEDAAYKVDLYDYDIIILDINLISGSGLDILKLLKNTQTKPWFKNTVFVVMSDHCASSAGRWELEVKNYHIPILSTTCLIP